MFDFLKTPIVRTVIRRGVLAATGALAVWLVKRGLASTEEAQKLASDLVEPLVAIALIAYDISRQKATKAAEARIQTALNLPAGSNAEDLLAALQARR